jgi:hypothetical protein
MIRVHDDNIVWWFLSSIHQSTSQSPWTGQFPSCLFPKCEVFIARGIGRNRSAPCSNSRDHTSCCRRWDHHVRHGFSKEKHDLRTKNKHYSCKCLKRRVHPHVTTSSHAFVNVEPDVKVVISFSFLSPISLVVRWPFHDTPMMLRMRFVVNPGRSP